MAGRKSEDVDPITRLLTPPSSETPEERIFRLQQEAVAKHASDEIDAQIERERESQRKGNAVKMLLLGQSGSGKHVAIVSPTS